MTTQEPLPDPQNERRPNPDDIPRDEEPLEIDEPRQDAPGESDGPPQKATEMFRSAFGGASAGERGAAEASRDRDAGYTGGYAAGDGGAVGMRSIVAEEANDARLRGEEPESPANEAQADV